MTQWIAVNRDFFGPDVTGWGSPGGASPRFTSQKDHPAVAEWPAKAS